MGEHASGFGLGKTNRSEVGLPQSGEPELKNEIEVACLVGLWSVERGGAAADEDRDDAAVAEERASGEGEVDKVAQSGLPGRRGRRRS